MPQSQISSVLISKQWFELPCKKNIRNTMTKKRISCESEKGTFYSHYSSRLCSVLKGKIKYMTLVST